MSSEIFEKNVADAIRHGALEPDAARARERFLREIAPVERRSWKLAAAAAALLVAVTIVWSARKAPVVDMSHRIDPPAPAAVLEPLRGNNDLLKGSLTLPAERSPRPLYRFVGKSSLPDGLVFKTHVQRLSERYAGGRLEAQVKTELSPALELAKGAFDLEWESRLLGPIRVDVSAQDEFQQREMVQKLQVKESERKWSFEFLAWNDRLRTLLGPQLAELSALAREVRELLERIEAATAKEAAFKERLKGFVAEAERLQARAEGFAKSSVYPASAAEVGFAARNLAQSMPIFTWEDGKFAGPKSYYTNGKVENSYRNEPFDFKAMRRYLDEAERIAAREFALWILKDIRRAGLLEDHKALVTREANRPGIAEVAERLRNGELALETELRQISK